MKIIEVKSLAINDVKVIKFGKYADNRGYFTEPYRKSDFTNNELLSNIFKDISFYQQNESYSHANVLRGLHFQWNPFMGKLVRTIRGRMIDIVMDIRKNSPTLGKAIMYDMPSQTADDSGEWIWVPPGFAHGNLFTEETTIEYLCTGEYSPGCEAGVSPLSEDIDWSLCPVELKSIFENLTQNKVIISEKDKLGLGFKQWLDDSRSDNFIFGKC